MYVIQTEVPKMSLVVLFDCFVHLTNCMDDIDDKKWTPAEKEDSHNDTHLGNNHILSIIGQLVTIIQIGFVIATMILTVMVALCSSIRLCESCRTFLTNQKL